MYMRIDSPLEEELEFFASQKSEWLKYYKGQYALVKGHQLLGTYTTMEQAFVAGVRALGNQPMLIKQVTEKEEIMYISALARGTTLYVHP